MGLSTLWSKLLHLRRATTTKPTPAITSHAITSHAAPLLSGRSLKSLNPATLLSLLSTLSSPLTSSQLSLLSTHIATSFPLLSSLIQTLTTSPSPPLPSDPPRDHYCSSSWVVSTLFRFGPYTLRQALSTHPDLIRTIAAVFQTPSHELDAARATNCADVLRAMLWDFPRETAAALQHSHILSDLVTHIPLQPAADLIPRFLSHRVFSGGVNGAFRVMHKKAVSMMADVQTLLVSEFEKGVVEEDWEKVANCAEVIKEVYLRGCAVKKKNEDMDERGDGAYCGNLGIVTSAMFNDAVGGLRFEGEQGKMLLKRILEGGWEKGGLEFVRGALSGIREMRGCVVTSVRREVLGVDMGGFGSVLLDFRGRLAGVLKGKGERVGRKRLLVLDVVRESMEVLPEGIVEELLMGKEEDEERVLEGVLDVGRRFAGNDLVDVRVGQILNGIFRKHGGQVGRWLMDDGKCLLEYLDSRKEDRVLDGGFGGLVAYMESHDLAKLGKGVRGVLERVAERFEIRRAADEEIEERGLKVKRGSESEDGKVGEEVEGEEYGNEDYGVELYYMHLLQEVSWRRDRKKQPGDCNVPVRRLSV